MDIQYSEVYSVYKCIVNTYSKSYNEVCYESKQIIWNKNNVKVILESHTSFKAALDSLIPVPSARLAQWQGAWVFLSGRVC